MGISYLNFFIYLTNFNVPLSVIIITDCLVAIYNKTQEGGGGLLDMKAFYYSVSEASLHFNLMTADPLVGWLRLVLDAEHRISAPWSALLRLPSLKVDLRYHHELNVQYIYILREAFFQ